MNNTTLSRRHFLKAAAGSAALVATGKAFAQPFGAPRVQPARELANVPESDHFPLGLASGDVTSDSAILWTRYTGTNNVLLKVWQKDGENFKEVLSLDAKRGEGGYVHVDVTNLAAFTPHQFAFLEVADSLRSLGRTPLGNFKTAPEGNALV